jgi:hypothetical protein
MRKDGTILGYFLNGIVKLVDGRHYREDGIETLVSELRDRSTAFYHLRQFLHNKEEHIQNFLNHHIQRLNYSSLDEMRKRRMDGFPKIEQAEELVNYDKCRKLFDDFSLKTQYAYLRLVSQSMVLIVAGVLENFRDIVYSTYGLDPYYTFSAARYSWDAAFYMTKSSVQLVTCSKIRKIIDDGIMGGLSFVSKRICQSNTPQYGSYDPKKPQTELLFCDQNSQYSWSMRQYLPVSNYEFMTSSELAAFDYHNQEEDTGIGFIFCVSVMYPPVCQDLLDIPIIPTHDKIHITDLSSKQIEYMSTHPNSKNVLKNEKRLLLTFYPKDNIPCYYKNLKFWLKNGIVLRKVHCGIRFKEEKIFRKYIDKNISLRKNAAQSNERDKANYFKYLNNVIAGRCQLDKTSYDRAEFCFSAVRAKKLLAAHSFNSFDIMGEDLTLFRLKKSKCQDENYRILGFVILELSKLKFYDGYYNQLKKYFGNNLIPIYGYTDSILAEITLEPGKSLTDDLKMCSNFFDFSNLPRTHCLYSRDNEFEPGMWKLCYEKVLEFVGMRPTSYSLKILDTNEDLAYVYKAAGVAQDKLDMKLSHELYKKCVEDPRELGRVKMQKIKRVGTSLFLTTTDRLTYHGLDVSRYIISNTLSFPYGYYRLLDDDD